MKVPGRYHPLLEISSTWKDDAILTVLVVDDPKFEAKP